MWKKVLEGGLVLGAISFVLFFCSSLIFNYEVNFYGISLKTIEIFKAGSAFGISVSLGIIAMAAFAQFCLSGRNIKSKTLEEKTTSHLKFRGNGDVDYDPKSRHPRFVEYNNVRLQIQLAKDSGKKEIMTNLSIACWDQIALDRYSISVVDKNEDGYRHLIKW